VPIRVYYRNLDAWGVLAIFRRLHGAMLSNYYSPSNINGPVWMWKINYPTT